MDVQPDTRTYDVTHIHIDIMFNIVRSYHITTIKFGVGMSTEHRTKHIKIICTQHTEQSCSELYMENTKCTGSFKFISKDSRLSQIIL